MLLPVPSLMAAKDEETVLMPLDEKSTTSVPSLWLYQLEKFVPVMVATSAERLTVEATVGM